MNKRTISIEELDNGKLRVTVEGRPYIVAGSNLSYCDIRPHWLSDQAGQFKVTALVLQRTEAGTDVS